MKKIIHTALSRGHADHGWLNTHHTFSFADYYDPQRIHFGMLRVLNDDTVAGGRGFDTHSHDNMEIITIPLEGDLEHRDSMGNVSVIRKGEIQVMSAGTGITHSEYNKNPDKPVEFLQIWIYPDAQNHKPRYDTIKIDYEKARNEFMPIVVPRGAKGGAWINQDAWISIAHIDAGRSAEYILRNPVHGIYIFIIKGTVELDSTRLGTRDGMGVWEVERIEVEAVSLSEVLVIEVPMNG